jgi:hypothetical protein
MNYQSEFRAGQALFNRYGSGLDYLNDRGYIDWNRVTSLASQAMGNLSALDSLVPDQERREKLFSDSSARETFAQFNEKYAIFKEKHDKFAATVALREEEAEDNWVDSQLDLCDQIRRHRDDIKDWVVFNAAAKEAEDAGLGGIVEMYKAGMPHEEILPLYRKSMLRSLIGIVIDENDAWSPKLDLWDEIMTLPEYNKLSYVARAEESGCEVFVNTDDSGTIFPELYILDYSVKVPSEGKWMDDYVYFESIADLLSECKKLFGVYGKSFEDLQRKLDAYSESHSYDVELLNVHQFESC